MYQPPQIARTDPVSASITPKSHSRESQIHAKVPLVQRRALQRTQGHASRKSKVNGTPTQGRSEIGRSKADMVGHCRGHDIGPTTEGQEQGMNEQTVLRALEEANPFFVARMRLNVGLPS
jgi:hypothetical protein